MKGWPRTMFTCIDKCRRISLLWVAIVALPGSWVRADLIAYYNFDTGADDLTGNGYDGIEEGDAVLAGPNSGFDATGRAFQFSGQGHIVIPMDINPEAIPDLTVTMWVKPDAALLNSPGLYKVFGHDNGGWDRTFGLDNRNGPYRYTAFDGGASGVGPIPGTGTPITENWTFLAAVWETDPDDDAVGTVRFHVNQNSVTAPLVNTFGFSDAAIGNLRPDNFSEGWRGLIDEVQIYDSALTPAEIEDIRLVAAPTVPGDANRDGVVTLADYNLIQANSFTEDPLGAPYLGDVNADQFVDFLDFRIWKDNFPGGPVAAELAIAGQTVPEPSSLAGIVCGLVALLSYARHRPKC
jgi:hypothetical protein